MSGVQESTAIAPTTATSATAESGARARVQLGIAPTSLEDGWRLAQMMAKSSLVPKAFQNKPEDVLVAVELGIEVGLAPMQALQSIAVINGRPSLWGDGFLALIMASPQYQDHDEFYEVDGKRVDGLTASDWEKPTTAAVCTFWRKGKQTPTTERFTVARAKKAGLLGKEGPWQQYPDRMLKLRARGFAGRDAFPDVLRGIRSAEESLDEPLSSEPGRFIQQPRRLDAAAASTESAAAPAPSDSIDAHRPAAAPVNPGPIRPVYQAGTVCRISEVTQPPGKNYWYIETDAKALTHTYEADVAKNAQAAKELGAAVKLAGEAIEKFPTAPFRIDALEVVDEAEAGR